MRKPPIEERFPEMLAISSFDLLKSPECILERIKTKLKAAKIVCLNCHDYVTFKFEKKYWSHKCKCGITIFYPPKKSRNYAYAKRYISKDDYDGKRSDKTG